MNKPDYIPRPNVVSFRLSCQELEDLDTACKLAGRTRHELIYRAIFGRNPK